MHKGSDNIIANEHYNHDLILKLRTSLKKPARKSVRELFFELNPHLRDNQNFINRHQGRKDAAVMIPIIARHRPSVLLTVRSKEMPSHAGEISFPGGRVDNNDTDHQMTALRELEEEVGVTDDRVEILGDIGIHHGGRGYRVSTYVGLIDDAIDICPCPREVEEAFEVPLDFLTNLNNHQIEKMNDGDVEFKVFSIQYKDYYIWGLTAGILRSFAEQIGS